jgi:UDP-N-acetylglucosamine 2-epimerase (non-hydrolysing)
VLATLRDVGRDIPLVWPMEASVLRQLRKHRLDGSIDVAGISRLAPQSYVDHIALLRGATCVLTDSWDVQEEATALAVPCITIGGVPARSVTMTIGSNSEAGRDRVRATRLVWECLFTGGKRGRVPELWDGNTGTRIARYLAAWLRGAERTAVRGG